MVASTPIDESRFDSHFWAGTEREQYYVYNGATYRANEVNYIGVGMYEAWKGDSMETAFFWAYLWKEMKFSNRIPSENELFWYQNGYEAYSKLEMKRLRDCPPSAPPNSGSNVNVPSIFIVN